MGAILKSIVRLFNYLKIGVSYDRVSIHRTAIVKSEYGGSISIGEFTEVREGVLILTYGGDITIGANCSINPYAVIYGHGGLQIGNNVLIAAHCVIIPSNHNFSNLEIPINQQGLSKRGIVIENDVWLGAGVKVLDGVKIGEGSIVGAGSVVTTSIPPYCVYVGIPAKFLRKR